MEVLELWIGRVCWFIAFVICCGIVKRELNNRSHPQTDEKYVQNKYMSIFSMMAMINAAFYCLLLVFNLIPYICLISDRFISIGSWSFAILFGFCQLSRLYYCFSKAQSHSNKGYPRWLFIVMYSNGIMILIGWAFSEFFFLRVKQNEDDSVCVTTHTDTSTYLLFFQTMWIWYILWDLITLSLYLFKIIQLNKINHDKNKDKIMERIKFILNKTLILTISFEICTAIQVVMWLVGHALGWSFFLNVLFAVICSICMIISALIVHLFMEHNLKDYLRCLRLIDQCGCIYWICCCCKKVVENAKPHMKAHEVAVNVADDSLSPSAIHSKEQQKQEESQPTPTPETIKPIASPESGPPVTVNVLMSVQTK